MEMGRSCGETAEYQMDQNSDVLETTNTQKECGKTTEEIVR